MPPSQGPLIPRRRLGHELRKLREAAGMQLVDAAKRLECSPSKVSRLETGQGLPKLRDVRDLLDLYEVRDHRLRTRLQNLATASQEDAWWSDHPEAWPPNMGSYISLESAATGMQSFSGFAVPGLVQIPAYCREIFRNNFPEAPDSEIDQLVEIRGRRQQYVIDRLGELQVTGVIDESVLHRVVHSPETMRRQLDHLINFARHDSVELRIFPYTAGYNLGIQSNYIIFTFDSDTDRDTVYQELSGDDRFSAQESEVKRYQDIFVNLLSKCPDQKSSLDLIEKVMKSNYE
ncbi:helix-turn-helix domain-containing protein [Kutzneria sp. NPDC052558]|uniref:helix-turn-helix domain-containing protein n=1 Tax=Kutzneria sp. NPDC052558 TaxID=3364121 RepID=UPI0037C7349B